MIARRALLSAGALAPLLAVTGARADEIALEVLTASVVDLDAPGRVGVVVQFAESEHTRLFEYSMMHLNEEIEILLDGRLLMAPFVREPLKGGSILVSGAIERIEANDIVRALSKPGAKLTLRTK